MNRKWVLIALALCLAGVGAIYLKRHGFVRDFGKRQLAGTNHSDARSDDPRGDTFGDMRSDGDRSTGVPNVNLGVELGRTPLASPTAQTQATAQARDAAHARLLAMYDTPIEFYGKVVDESGHAVSGAKTMIIVEDKPWESGTRFEAFSDEGGLFSLINVRGAALVVKVAKDNYYSGERARIRFAYGAVRTAGDPELPTSSNPAVFVLKAKGKAEPLVHIRRQSFRIAKDGTPFDMVLAPASERSPNYLRVEALTQDTTKNDKGRYDWRCRLTLGGGGLAPRLNEFDFMAPANGYQESVEVVMSANDPNWRGAFQQEYFAKLPNGCYARLYFDLATRGSHSCAIEAFINPLLGSRNLEYDPALEVK